MWVRNQNPVEETLIMMMNEMMLDMMINKCIYMQIHQVNR